VPHPVYRHPILHAIDPGYAPFSVTRCAEIPLKHGQPTEAKRLALMKTFLLAAAVALLPGLALAQTQQQVWLKAGGTQTEFEVERHDCMLEAARYPLKIGDMVMPNYQLFEPCMQAHGWHMGSGTPFR
jgi:hypothetical protein